MAVDQWQEGNGRKVKITGYTIILNEQAHHHQAHLEVIGESCKILVLNIT